MKSVITISREFGSGGRSIGKAVAEALGYDFYDKELIERIAEETGLSREYIERNGEHARNKNIFAYAFVGRDQNGVSIEDYLWRKQREIILELAEKGNCVIVGRCADYILRDRSDCLHVFIHADLASRIERITTLYGETDRKPEKRLEDKDKTRRLNYQYYTDREWGMSQNYDLSLCSSSLDPDFCRDIIVSLAQ